MDVKNTEKTGFTDTGSTIFVDSNNDIKNQTTFSSQISKKSDEGEQNQTFSPENQEIAGENRQNKNESLENAGEGKELLSSGDKLRSELLSNESKTAFSAEFPDVDVEKLCTQGNFQAFIKLLTENPTLSQIYSCFNAIEKSAAHMAESRALQSLANKASSIGALSEKESAQEPYFTKEQVLRMSSDEIKRNFEKIRNSQSKW